MSRSPTITEADWLPNDHAGEMLVSEFLEPLGMDLPALAGAINVPVESIEAVVTGVRPMDGELDLRLARYFKMSEGFFLRLQYQHDLLAAKRRLSRDALDRIVPRAA